MTDSGMEESIDAIRSVRLAAHELTNACATLVGGTQMAISLATVTKVARPTMPLKKRFAALWKM